METTYKSRVYTERPAYADYDSARKFEAIKSIIAKRLKEHPSSICSYSGGSDSDILIHLIETVRGIFGLPPVKYAFLILVWSLQLRNDMLKKLQTATALN